MSEPPRFASALSTDPDAAVAEERCIAILRDRLGGTAPDLLVVFVTHHYGAALDGLGARLRAALGSPTTIGCTGLCVVGARREVESKPGLSVWAACLPGTRVRGAYLEAEFDEGNAWTYSGLPAIEDPQRAGVVLLGEPFTFPMPEYLKLLARDLPGVPVVGGMASGGHGPGQNLIFLDDEVLSSGTVAVALEGDVELCATVSQGCRPVGEPLVITGCDDHLVLKLKGRPAAKMMLQMLEGLEEGERRLFKKGAFLGIAIDPTKSRFAPNDLLVRNVVHLDLKQDAIAVAERGLRVGQSVQFMVRDADSAAADLEDVLGRSALEWAPEGAPPGELGGLLFTCSGRGSRMFPTLHHDITCLQSVLGPDLPVAGFFANGEIGPVGGESFMHGHSASVAVFRERR